MIVTFTVTVDETDADDFLELLEGAAEEGQIAHPFEVKREDDA